MSSYMVYKSHDKSLFKNPSFNVSNTDLCVFMNTDLFYLPYIREFVYLERFCPINQVNHTIIIITFNVIHIVHFMRLQ